MLLIVGVGAVAVVGAAFLKSYYVSGAKQGYLHDFSYRSLTVML